MTHRHLRLCMSKTVPYLFFLQCPILNDITSQVRNLKIILSPALPLGGPIHSRSKIAQIWFFLFMPSHVDIWGFVISHHLPPLWFDLHIKGKVTSKSGNVIIFPPRWSTCWLSPPQWLRDGGWTLELPCNARPTSPVSSCPEHPALQHARMLPGSLTAPCSFTTGPWNKAFLLSGLSFFPFPTWKIPIYPSNSARKSPSLERKSPFLFYAPGAYFPYLCYYNLQVCHVSRFTLYTLRDQGFCTVDFCTLSSGHDRLQQRTHIMHLCTMDHYRAQGTLFFAMAS